MNDSIVPTSGLTASHIGDKIATRECHMTTSTHLWKGMPDGTITNFYSFTDKAFEAYPLHGMPLSNPTWHTSVIFCRFFLGCNPGTNFGL